MTIVTGQDYWVMSLSEWAEKIAGPIAKGRNLVLLPPDAENAVNVDAEPAPVMVNHGKLFAMCQSRGCAGVDLIWPNQPAMWCSSCGNAEIGGRWRPVLQPPPSFLAAVDKILSGQPEPYRNWKPNESIKYLMDISRKNRHPVPDDLGDLADDDTPYSVWLLNGRQD